MKLSILIPLYNKEKYVERCLDSLLEQDLPKDHYEIVIVDDGSKDTGPAIVDSYAKEHANIHITRQKNQGPSAARNKCLALSKGEYLYFMDADDYLATNVLQDLLSIAENGQIEILEFDTKHTTNAAATITQSETKSPTEQVGEIVDGMAYVAQYGFRNEAWRYFVQRSLLDSSGVKFIEGTLYEDAIFTASLFLNAKRMAKVAMDVHRYVVVENSIVTSKDRAHNLKFIKGMVFAIEHFYTLTQKLDPSDRNYQMVVNKLKARQQGLTFALIIRTLKYRPINFKELKDILEKLKAFDAYPIDPKLEGLGAGNASFVHRLFVPIFNNKTLLGLGMGIMGLIPGR